MSQPAENLVAAIGQMTTLLQELQLGVGELRSDMNTKMGELRSDMNTKMGELRSDMNTKMSDMNNKIGRLTTETEGLKQLTNKLNNSIGDLTEHQCRKFIERMHGWNYARERTLRTLEDVAQFVLFAEYSSDVRASRVMEAATKLAQWLLDKQVAQQYLRALHAALEHGKQSDDADADLKKVSSMLTAPWFDGDTPLTANIRQFMSRLGSASSSTDERGHIPLRTQLGWLVALLDKLPKSPEPIQPPQEAQPQEAPQPAQEDQPLQHALTFLLAPSCQGGTLGLVLAQFAAAMQAGEQQQQPPAQSLPPSQWYFPPTPKKYEQLKMASDTMQCDAQGTIQVYAGKAIIRVGEVKRSADGYGKGVDQLRKRLVLLAWAVRVLFPGVTEITKFGKLFIPRSAASKQDHASEEHGMHIDVEHVV